MTGEVLAWCVRSKEVIQGTNTGLFHLFIGYQLAPGGPISPQPGRIFLNVKYYNIQNTHTHNPANQISQKVIISESNIFSQRLYDGKKNCEFSSPKLNTIFLTKTEEKSSVTFKIEVLDGQNQVKFWKSANGGDSIMYVMYKVLLNFYLVVRTSYFKFLTLQVIIFYLWTFLYVLVTFQKICQWEFL